MRNMLVRMSLAAALVAGLWGFEQPSPALGTPAPAFALRDTSGAPVRLEDFRGRKHVLLAFVPAAEIGLLQPAAAELAKFDTVLVPAPVAADSGQARAAIESYAVKGRTLVLIDKRGMVRRMERDASPGVDPAGIVRKWQRGRDVYEAMCTRCHGDDGNAASYIGIKTLGGIGNRMSEARILEATLETGVVDLSSYDRESLEAMAAYVAGL